jgi:hypothetical protein
MDEKFKLELKLDRDNAEFARLTKPEMIAILSNLNIRPVGNKPVLIQHYKSYLTERLNRELQQMEQPHTEAEVEVEGGMEEEKQGSGLKQKNKHLHPFGNKHINIEKLKNNQVDIRDNLGRVESKFRNVIVSDLFINYIKSILNNKKLTENQINKLSNHEQVLFHKLFSVVKIPPTQKGFSLALIKKRIKLIEGEIIAGNDNKANLIELRDLLNILSKMGVISIKDARSHYNKLCKYNNV